MIFRGCVFAALYLLHSTVIAQEGNHRLPTAIKPEHYNLKILTHLGDENGFLFRGDETITLNVYENTNQIFIHAKDLKLDVPNVTVKRLDQTPITITHTEFQRDLDFFKITLGTEVVKGDKLLLYIPFSANLNEGLNGFYRSSYFNKRLNQTRYLAVSNYEPVYARWGYPCFDEPAMKAKYTLSLGHHKSYTSVSNMPLSKSEPLDSYKPEWVLNTFEESVPMSPYLLAYTVFDFKYKASEHNPTYKTWAREDALDQVDYSNEVGPKVLEFFEKYFDIKYPLPKLDMLAIPDFSAGAMENWGLITYRETNLLYSPNVTSSNAKETLAAVIAHELAHQWFGNLVTMKWWTDLWLNEGFATYVSSLGIRDFAPSWNSYNDESLQNLLHIFDFDSLKSSHPVSVAIKHTNEIALIFDFISYKKGSTIIRMMHLFLGEEAFRDGVTNYLRKYKYGNAEQKDLWDSLTASAHKYKTLPETLTVNEIMDTWTLLTGYPMITVERNYEDNTAVIRQERYLSSKSTPNEDKDQCWWVPLSYTTSKEADFKTLAPKEWLGCKNGEAQTLTIKNLPADEWVMFNIGLSSLYKVKYDKKNYDMLINHLKGPDYKKISEMNRAQILTDTLTLAWTGTQSYNIAFNLLEYLKQERDYIPWKAALSALNDVDKLLARTNQYNSFKSYMATLISPIYERQGGLNVARGSTESEDIIKIKTLISSWACRIDIKDCIDKSKQMFKEWISKQENTIPSDLRATVYCNAIKSGTKSEWNFLFNEYKKSQVATEKLTILASLACSRDKQILESYLNHTLSSASGIRTQDSPIPFGAVARNPAGFSVAKQFLEQRLGDIYKNVQGDPGLFKKYPEQIAGETFSEQEYSDFNNLVTKAPVFTKMGQVVRSSLEKAGINKQVMSKNFAVITTILTAKSR